MNHRHDAAHYRLITWRQENRRREEDVGDDDLRFREFAGYVGRALEKRGYLVCDDADGADVVVVGGAIITLDDPGPMAQRIMGEMEAVQ